MGGGEAPRQHVPFAGEAGAFSGGEAGLGQGVADRARHAPGGQGGVRRGQAGTAPEQGRRPHVGVLPGIEAVQVEGVHRGSQPRQAGFGFPEHEGQDDSATGEGQAVEARCRHRPVLAQGLGQGLEFGPGGVEVGQIVAAEGVFLHGQVVEAVGPPGIGLPGGPGGEEVESGAEAVFQDDEAGPAGPAPWQPVAGQEDMAGLSRSAVGGVIDIAVILGPGHAVGREGQAGGLQGRAGHQCMSRLGAANRASRAAASKW